MLSLEAGASSRMLYSGWMVRWIVGGESAALWINREKLAVGLCA